MRPSRTSWRPRGASAPAALALVGALLACGGCVTRGVHRGVVEERDALQNEVALLENRVRLLEASNESLSNERVTLIADVEDLGTEREKLAASVEELRAARDQLEQNLALTSSQLAARNAEVQQLRETYDGLVSDLQTEVASGRVQIEQLRDGLNVKLSQAVLFPSGSADLSAEGEAVLGKVAGRLLELPHRILVQGHTDDVPIRGSLAQRYPSNWELAGARAARVVRILAERGVPSARLSAVSLADTQPVASNDTPEGRAANRRIEIRMLPAPGDAPAPAPSEPTAAASPAKAAASPATAGALPAGE
jgi:chemotaxis protein MotB